MRNGITVKRDELYSAYQHIKEAIVTLQLMLAEVGCVHSNGQNITTLADKSKGIKKWLCFDCNQTIEEEIEDV